jgi:predicted HicB family RNase H-like nuclease
MNENRKKYIMVRMSRGEHRQLRIAAALEELSMAEFVKQAMLKQVNGVITNATPTSQTTERA